ncbi:metallophosphoesterase [Halocynthiibacter styelae]|uniref:Metallophosphoesterase n=1 Tax=Halocynthiibacter styelae TaxID=2761955 RepID=A0A8J7IXI8_9RHOB|nr:metallophosphoesterase [Paenihalocynthiibacter styelae]MBI1493915.1 metallophosphoesterase [Paenihalocynthiibacter styelae]
MRHYAIGDVHGHLDKLQSAMALIARDRDRVDDPKAPVVQIGDLVDRGPDSKGVIEFMIEGVIRGEPWVTLLGNHDRQFLWWLEDPERRDPVLKTEYTWLHERIGGLTTLASYGVDITAPISEMHRQARSLVPDDHIDFLNAMPNRYTRDRLFFAHAGIRPSVPLDQQTEDDLIWIRGEFHNHPDPHDALIIHGHTPVKAATHYGNRINIDSGAAWGHDLSAVVIEERKAWLLTVSGRVPLPHQDPHFSLI